ncbi:MAG: DNA repair protein RadC [Rikenellaceae bacterium]
MAALADRVLSRGVESLSDVELLTLLLGEDALCERSAQSLLQQHAGSLAVISQQSPSRLRMCEGLGLKRAVTLLAAAELGRRVALEQSEQCHVITSSRDVVDIFRPILSPLSHEEFWVLYLTSSNSIIDKLRVSQGGVNSTVVDTKLIIKRGVELLASQIIVVHNHPSGSAAPSDEDISLTEKIRQAAELFDINLVDHLILAASEEYSFVSSKISQSQFK